MIEKIVVELLTRLLSLLLEKGSEIYKSHQSKVVTEKDVDERLKQFKEAYTEAFDGNPITPEQRKRLNQSIANFILGNPPGSL